MNSNSGILIVDDMIDLREMLQILLYGHFPNLFFASNGEEAVHILEQKDIDLIVTDLEMPHRDGKWLIEEVSKRFNSIPIVVVTGNIRVTEAEVLKWGGKALLAKPYAYENLKEVIWDVLNESAGYRE